MSYSDDSVVQKRARVSGIRMIRVLIVAYDSYKQTYLCTAVSYDTLGTATAPVSACLQPTCCLAARTARGELSQADKHTSSKRRYIRVLVLHIGTRIDSDPIRAKKPDYR